MNIFFTFLQEALAQIASKLIQTEIYNLRLYTSTLDARSYMNNFNATK